jgi:hypothetical protein
VTSRRAGESPAGDLFTDDSHVLLSLAGRPVVPEQCLGMHQRAEVADLVRVTTHEHTPPRFDDEDQRVPIHLGKDTAA